MTTLPEALLQSLKSITGFNEETFKTVHHSGEQVISIRFNPNKSASSINTSPYEGVLDGVVPWSSNGVYLRQRPSFTLDPLFHAGAYYVQEASSMFLEQVLKQVVDLSKPIKVLDLCAAPGGKSTLIQSLISNESLLVSNEVIKSRVNILSENLTKWGAANVIVTNNDPADFKRLENYFDIIVVDAPCSGSGLFRKDPGAMNEWSENNVVLCAQRQQRIIADIMPALKNDGVLIYSTCSYSLEEDEEIADWLVDAFQVESVQLKTEPCWGIVETVAVNSGAFGYRFYPDKVKGEGFFIAAFKKNKTTTVDIESKVQSAKQSGKVAFTAKELEGIQPFLKQPESFFYFKQNDEAIAFPVTLVNELFKIQAALYIKKAGVKLGSLIRNELIPAHELAVSNIINLNLLKIELEYEEALQYLRRQEWKLHTPYKGWILLTYRQLPLGWIKALPNRINNYYPKDWRIINK